jgi:hypothetical protein
MFIDERPQTSPITSAILQKAQSDARAPGSRALLVVTALIWRTEETVAHPRGLWSISLRPSVSAPAQIRAEFVAPALTGFGAMALVGFFAAIGPTVLAQDLHETNHAVAGALFGEMAIIVSATILATQSMSSGTAMRLGLWPMIRVSPCSCRPRPWLRCGY